MSWYVRTASREIGPLSEAALRALVSTGQVGADTQICQSGTTRWTTVEAAGLVSSPPDSVLAGSAPESVEPVEQHPPQSLEPAEQGPAQRFVGPVEQSPAPLLMEPQPLEILATPWRRFWARMLDLLLDSVLIGIIVGVLRPSLLENSSLLSQSLLSVPVALLIDCLLYAVFGTTPGKALAGIQVVADRGGGRLAFRAYFKRSVEIYIFGFALGLPLVGFVTLFLCYRKLAGGETLSWDQYAESVVIARSTSWIRTSIVALIYLGLFAGLVMLGRIEQSQRAVAAERVREIELRNLAEQRLQSMATTINNRGTLFVRPNNRFDSAHAGPGLMFTYEYTMTAMRKSQLSAEQLEQFRQGEQDRLFQAACRGSLIYMFRSADTLRAHYSDPDGAELATAEVRRPDCGWRD